MFESIEILDRIRFRITDTEILNGIVIAKYSKAISLGVALINEEKLEELKDEFIIILPETPKDAELIKKTNCLRPGYEHRYIEPKTEGGFFENLLTISGPITIGSPFVPQGAVCINKFYDEVNPIDVRIEEHLDKLLKAKGLL